MSMSTPAIWAVVASMLAVSVAKLLSASSRRWSGLQPLVFSFLPSHVSYRGREYVVLQSEDKGRDALYQLYLLVSDTRGRFDGSTIPLTEFSERIGVPYVERHLKTPGKYRGLSREKAGRILGYDPQHDLASMVDLGLAMQRGDEIDLIATGVPYGKAS